MNFRIDSIQNFLDDILSLDYFQPDPAHDNTPAIDAKLDAGENKLVLVSGENASGKSLIRRIVTEALQKNKIECIHLSQEGRQSAGIVRAFIYGDEHERSTGYNSAKTVTTSISTSQNRTNMHALFYDEPDIGLSEGYAAGVGQKIATFMKNPPEKLFASFLVSHSKALVSQLAHLNPWYLRLGNRADLKTWLAEPIIPKNIELLKEEGLQRLRRIQKIMDATQTKKKQI